MHGYSTFLSFHLLLFFFNPYIFGRVFVRLPGHSKLAAIYLFYARKVALGTHLVNAVRELATSL